MTFELVQSLLVSDISFVVALHASCYVNVKYVWKKKKIPPRKLGPWFILWSF